MKIQHRPPGARKKSKKDREGTPVSIPERHGYFRSFDGTRLFYSVEGEGTPMIFCYGLVCSSLHWTYQIEHFRRSYQTIWMDYRGHQNSDTPPDIASVTLDSLAKDLNALMDELKIENAIFLGHSMGVNVVLEFYRQFPHRVKSMILSNGTPTRPLETLLHTSALEPGFRLLEYISEKSPSLLKTIWRSQKANPLVHKTISLLGFNPYLTPREDVALYVDQLADLDPKIFLHLIRNYDQYDGTSWLHTIQVPTLVFAGERDRVVPLAQQELLAQLIPNSEYFMIKHGSHCPQMDLPDLVNTKIDDFLKRNKQH